MPAFGASTADPLRHLPRLTQLLALLAMLLIIWRKSDIFSKMAGQKLLLIGGFVLSGVGLAVVFAANCGLFSLHEPYSTMMAHAVALLTGICMALTITLWSSFLSVIGEHRILLFCAICVGAAAGLAMLMTLLLPLAAILTTLFTGWVSLAALAILLYRRAEIKKPLGISAKVSDRHFNIHTKSTVSVMLYNTAIGFAVCYIAGSASGLFGAAMATLAVIVASIIVALDTTKYQIITESLLLKLHMPVMIVGIAPMFFPSQTLRIVGCCLLLCFFMIVYIINLTALSEHVRIDKLNPVRVFGFGRAGNAAGFLFGAMGCYLGFFAPFLPVENNGVNWTTAVLLVLLAVFVVGSSFIFEDHYPQSKNPKLAVKPKTVTVEHHLPSSDLHTLSNCMLEQDGNQGAGHGIWSKRVLQLSETYGLSPKETEALFYLAKGRNAEYIQNEMVVSRHTAKAHIYHIYQKTGVHSRQDLINLLENIKVNSD